MVTTQIALYATGSGKVAMKIDETESKRGFFYSWQGLYGAASGLNLDDMKRDIASVKTNHKRIKLIFGTDLTLK